METKPLSVDRSRLSAYIRNADAIGAELREANEKLRELRRDLNAAQTHLDEAENFNFGFRGGPPKALVQARTAVEQLDSEVAAATAEINSIGVRRERALRLAHSVRDFARSKGVRVADDNDLSRSGVRE